MRLDKAREELQEAEVAIHQMEEAPDLRVFERAWKEYLRRLERTWYKACHQLERDKRYQGWTLRGRTERLRKNDPLLSYLTNARGAEEHTVTDVVRRQAGGLGINAAFGNSLHIEEMTISGDKVYIKSPQAIRLDIIPASIHLLPVLNRGRTYNPPTTHLGTGLTATEPVDVAKAGIEFYRDYIEAAERFFSR